LGGFSDFFETLFGGMGRQQGTGFGGFSDFQTTQRPRRGRNSEHSITIGLEEAFNGTIRVLQWDDGKKIEAKIPPGVKTGSRVRLRGKGESGSGGGESGDLFLKIEVAPHPGFQRDGDDLRIEVPVDFYIALLGGEAEVRSIDKSVKLTIPPEADNGKVFRLKGLGMPKLKKPEQRGDLYATVDIKMPKNLSTEEKHLVQQLQDMRRGN
jgi:curved DNA-binding protein